MLLDIVLKTIRYTQIKTSRVRFPVEVCLCSDAHQKRWQCHVSQTLVNSREKLMSPAGLSQSSCMIYGFCFDLCNVSKWVRGEMISCCRSKGLHVAHLERRAPAGNFAACQIKFVHNHVCDSVTSRKQVRYSYFKLGCGCGCLFSVLNTMQALKLQSGEFDKLFYALNQRAEMIIH